MALALLLLTAVFVVPLLLLCAVATLMGATEALYGPITLLYSLGFLLFVMPRL